MFRRALKILSWVRTRPERDFFTHTWTFSEIQQPHAFLKWVVSVVPDQSVWTVDGLYDRKARQFLGRFEARDRGKVFHRKSWFRLPFIEVNLDSESKPLIAAQIHAWDLDRDFIHQTICHGDTLYFLAYDNLQDTWLSRRITADQLRPVIANGVVSTEYGLNFDVISEEGWNQLTAFLAALVDAQRSNTFQDVAYWSGFFNAEARPTFWWEAEDAERDGFGDDEQGALGDREQALAKPSFSQVLSWLIEQLKNGDCEILGWRKLSEKCARVEFAPWTGLGCAQVMVEAFGHRPDPAMPRSIELPPNVVR